MIDTLELMEKYNSILSCGIECGSGWNSIIDDACRLIKCRIEIKSLSDTKIIQIKEKFGKLRIYIINPDDYINGVKDMASHMSSKTCDQCGSIGYSRTINRWITTVCDVCMAKNDRI